MLKVILIFFLIGGFISGAVIYTPIENPVRDYLADTITEDELVYINLTEYINTTIYINSTEYIYYPFVDGWNNIESYCYIQVFKQGSQSPFRFSYYDQVTHQIYNTDYHTYQWCLDKGNQLFYDTNLSIQQKDCLIIQLIILNS